jgi:hypothetical protein
MHAEIVIGVLRLYCSSRTPFSRCGIWFPDVARHRQLERCEPLADETWKRLKPFRVDCIRAIIGNLGTTTDTEWGS